MNDGNSDTTIPENKTTGIENDTTEQMPLEVTQKRAKESGLREMSWRPSTLPTHWPPEPRLRKRRSIFTTIGYSLAVACIALLILNGLALIILETSIHFQSTAQRNTRIEAEQTRSAILTPQARIHATANALATAQANIEIGATAQVAATMQATNNITGQEITASTNESLLTSWTTGNPVLDDALNANSITSAWDEGSVQTGTGCAFMQGNYHVTEAQKGYLQPCIAETTTFSNLAYQVNITFVKGSQGKAGILFRADPNNTSYYFFSIGPEGDYELDLYQASRGTILATGVSDSVNEGFGNTNQITVLANDGQILLFINEQYTTSVTDDQLVSGKIGLAAIDVDTPVDAKFSNVLIWQDPADQINPIIPTGTPEVTTPTATTTPGVNTTVTPIATAMETVINKE